VIQHQYPEIPSVRAASQNYGQKIETLAPTKGTVGLGLVQARAEEGKHDHETVDESEYDPRHPPGGI